MAKNKLDGKRAQNEGNPGKSLGQVVRVPAGQLLEESRRGLTI